MPNTDLPNHELLEGMLSGVAEAVELGIDFFRQWKSSGAEFPIPPMLSAPDRRGQLPITKKGYQSLQAWEESAWSNSSELSKSVTKAEWSRIVSENILASANENMTTLFGSREDQELDEDDLKILSRKVRQDLVKAALERFLHHRFHLFPAWFAGKSLSRGLDFGAVQFVPVQEQTKELQDEYEKANGQQRELVESAIQEFTEDSQGATCIIRVNTEDLSPNKSWRFARETARITLAAVLLPWGNNAIASSRLTNQPTNPARERYWSFQSGGMTIPGSSVRWPVIKEGNSVVSSMEDRLSEYKTFVERTLTTYLKANETNPSENLCVDLRSKWLSAVHWYDRAVSARLDSEAVIHLAVCLNVMSTGQSISKVTSAVTTLLGVAPADRFIERPSEVTFKQLCRRLYSDGRSQLLHGSREVVKEDFEADRIYGESLTRHVLSAYAYHLDVHETQGGEDNVGALMETAKNCAGGTKRNSHKQRGL